jgi:Zn-dependent protease with chaperone function
VLALAGLAILHATIAAAVVEGLLRAWRVHDPGQRLALRAVALTAPFVSPWLLPALFPMRASQAFLDRWSWFGGAHWDNLRVGGWPLSQAAAAVLILAGLAFFLRDALPFLADRIRRPDDGPEPGPHDDGRRRVAAALADLPARPSPDPVVKILSRDDAVLLCSGVGTPVITVSAGALARLDDEALRAALAHELEHIRRGDPALGWVLMLARSLQAFNPATQIVGRQIVQELEHRSDSQTARLGLGSALARAIARLSSLEHPHTDLAGATDARPWLPAWSTRAAARATDLRCERLLAGPAAAPGSTARRVTLAAAGVAAVLFFVV